MKNIIRSCFDKTDQAYIDYLEQFIIEASNYDKVFKVKNLLKDAERKEVHKCKKAIELGFGNLESVIVKEIQSVIIHNNIEPVICLTKLDLLTNSELQEVSGIKGLRFCHLARFIVNCEDLDTVYQVLNLLCK